MMLIECDVPSLWSELTAAAVAQRSVAESSGALVREECEPTAPFCRAKPRWWDCAAGQTGDVLLVPA